MIICTFNMISHVYILVILFFLQEERRKHSNPSAVRLLILWVREETHNVI